MSKRLNQCVILCIFIFNQIFSQFALAVSDNDIAAKSKAYEIAVLTYLKTNNGVEMLRVITEADPQEQVTARLAAARIDLSVNPNQRKGAIREAILKIISEEYVKIKTVEINLVIEKAKAVAPRNPEMAQQLVQFQLSELTAFLNLIKNDNTDYTLMFLSSAAVALTLALLAPFIIYIFASTAVYGVIAAAALTACYAVLKGTGYLPQVSSSSVATKLLYEKLDLYRQLFLQIKSQLEYKLNTKNILVLP